MIKSTLLGLGAMLLGLTVTGAASAGGGHGGGRIGVSGFGGIGAPPVGRIAGPGGVQFHGGHYYPGRHHAHFGPRVWSAQFGRYHYWDSFHRCQYYWYAPRQCYLPVGCTVPF
ncbi:MAG: hypothetical protein U0840_14670 [Gemmataceae bacterium]